MINNSWWFCAESVPKKLPISSACKSCGKQDPSSATCQGDKFRSINGSWRECGSKASFLEMDVAKNGKPQPILVNYPSRLQ